jgi:hypothetical protein
MAYSNTGRHSDATAAEFGSALLLAAIAVILAVVVALAVVLAAQPWDSGATSKDRPPGPGIEQPGGASGSDAGTGQ